MLLMANKLTTFSPAAAAAAAGHLPTD